MFIFYVLQRSARSYRRITTLACIFLLLILVAFQSIWVIGGSATGIIMQVGLQRTRSQAIAKDVLVLAYRPASEHAGAISELETILPRFEQAQAGLQHGDATLQLPDHVPGDVQLLIAASQPDYTAQDVALRAILSHPDVPLDPIQRDIVLNHVQNYSLLLTQINDTWREHIDSAFLHIFWIESGLVLILIAGTIISHILTIKQINEMRAIAPSQHTREEE